MAKETKSEQSLETQVWQKLDAFLTEQMQQVNELMEETNSKVAEIGVILGAPEESGEAAQTAKAEDLPDNYMDESESLMLDKVNQEMDKLVSNLSQQIDAIKDKNKL